MVKVKSNQKNLRYISMLDASKLCSYSQEYLSLLARKGKLFAQKRGRNWYTTREALDEYLKRQSVVIALPKTFFAQTSPAMFRSIFASAPVVSNKEQPMPIRRISQRDASAYVQPQVFERHMKPEPDNDPIAEKFDKLSDSLYAFTGRITEFVSRSVPAQPQVIIPQPQQVQPTSRGAWWYSHPRRSFALMAGAIIFIFLLVGGFSFGRADEVLAAVRKAFKDAETLGGYFPGTHANEVLVLDKAGNISIFGHIQTEGQLRSRAPDGVAPIVVDSITKVENLNADYLDDLHSKDFTLAFVTSNGNLTSEDVFLEGNVEVGKILTVKGAMKLRSNLDVYGQLGVFGNAVFGKEVKLTGGDLKLEQGNADIVKGNLKLQTGTIEINNSQMVRNLNSEYLQGLRPSNFTLDFVVGNGNETNQMAFFNNGIYGGDGAFGTLGVSGSAAIGSADNFNKINFSVYSKHFRVDSEGNLSAGDIGGSDLSLGGYVKSDLTPSGSYDLGKTSSPWDELFVTNANIAGNLVVSGSINFIGSTDIAGTVSSSFRINTDNISSDSEDSYLSFERGVGSTSNATLKWNSSAKRFEFNEPVRIASAGTEAALEIVGIASASQLFGAGLENCLAGNKLLWSSSTGMFSCVVDAGGVTSNSLDFDELVDSMTLDAMLTISSATYGIDWTHTIFTDASGNISMWTNDAGYLTTIASESYWDLAYSWGDHNLAGYLTSIASESYWDSAYLWKVASESNYDAAYQKAHDAVTLVGTPDYLTLYGQQITLNKLDISDDTNATGGIGVTLSANDFSFDCSEVEGTGINCIGGAITLDATGDWAGTLDTKNASDFLLNAGDTATGLVIFSAGASVSTNFEVTGNASASKTFGSGLVDCDNTTTSKLLWSDTGVFSCGIDQAGSAFKGIQVRENGGSFANIGSLSFSASGFNITNTASLSLVAIDWVNGPASRSIAQTISGAWNFTTNPTFTNARLVTSNSIDFDELVNAATLDSNFSIASAGYSWDFLRTNVEIGGIASIGNTLFVQKNGGNLGIGTTNPGSKLDVAGTAQLRGTAGGAGLYVNSSGNVGVGTTSPTNILSLGNSQNQKIWIENSSNIVAGKDLTLAAGSTVNYGTGNFVALSQTTRNWYAMAAAPNGNIYAAVSNGDIYMQTAGTGNFVALSQTTRNWYGMAAAPNGNIYAAVSNGDIYMQTAGTGNFVALSQTTRTWRHMTADSNGNVYAVVYGGDIYMQTGGTGDFVALSQTTSNWVPITAALNGNVYAAVYGGDIYMRPPITGTADLAGGNLILSSGKGKGSGASTISFYTGTTLGSGTDLQALSEKMTILGSGNIGIGTTVPSALTHIVGDAATLLNVASGSNSRFAVFESGNVGIGDTSPEQKLTISGNVLASASADDAELKLWSASNDGLFSLRASGSAGTDKLFITNGSANTPLMTIASTGYVGIGTTVPTYKLHVKDTSTADGPLLRLEDSNTTCDFTAEAGAPSCGSDLRLKKNITGIESSLEGIMSLNPVRYNWKTELDSDPTHSGFVAQEVQTAFPELVSSASWNDGKPALFLSTTGMIPYIIKAIQEQQTEIVSLSMRLEDVLHSNNVSGSAGEKVVISGGMDILGVLANTVEMVVRTIRATGDIISHGIKKTYYSVRELFPAADIGSMVANWLERDIAIDPTTTDEAASLFRGSAAKAAEQSKVDLDSNGAYLATYGVDSTRGEIQLSGTSELVAGEARIFYDFSFTSIISDKTPIRVIVTPTTNAIRGQLYVDTKNQYGFIVKELNGASAGMFDWLVIARRKGYEDIESNLPILSPTPEVSEEQNRGSSISQPNQNDLGEIGTTPSVAQTPTLPIPSEQSSATESSILDLPASSSDEGQIGTTPSVTPTPSESPEPTPTPSATTEPTPDVTPTP